MNYWLLKSEPDVYSIEDLKRDRTSLWDGVRNYQARNFLKEMEIGDLGFFYHSNTKLPGIVGLVKIIENHLIDPTQFDVQSPYFDSKATPNTPRWYTVKVEFVEQFSAIISLETLKQTFNAEEFGVVKRGNRLSVMPVSLSVAERILGLQ
ncbi:EVE domain-containing protein [Planktothrix mougeotii]|uniref:EVE domain-containing protein n=1 Tax=Planktothrix mougeotii LEGE 06226 TaxID=1828728 RepID=A0ABR9UJS9_9CYAN|nr:EVE domain-containing protein [Planktothrix mougeotii]MBE9146725.1 EVE domain-containing protein [Planktothrix mougeotii LEGE 06226]